MKTKQARFWFWHNDDWVRIKLNQGQSIHFHSGGPTDEGYSYEMELFEFDGEIVRRESATRARDCDGRFDTEWTGYCHVSKLASYICDDGTRTADWFMDKSGQRDYSAEAMGY